MSDAWQAHLPDGTTWRPVEPGESLAGAWTARWAEDPDAPAIIDLTGGPERTLTRADLERRSAAAAAVLADAGVRPGDRVLVSASASVPYLALYVGAIRLGAVVVPANTAYTRDELTHIAQDSGAALAVLDDRGRAPTSVLPVLVPAEVDRTGDGEPAGTDAEGASAAGGGRPGLDRATAGDLAMIAYTSGTTGRPKGALLTHENLLSSARAVVTAWRWTADDGLVLALPLFHMHGLGVGVHGSLVSGGRILLLGGFTADGVAAAASRDDATMVFGVPTMHKRLVELAEREPAAREALASLRLMVSGSAPLSDELWARIRDVAGQEVMERYGMTETVMNVSNPYDGARRPGTVGLPLPGVEVRLDGDDDTGEILVRGQNVFAGYHERPDATRESFTDDGWFRTGDIGHRSEDGYVAIVGRSKELIISGGFNVYPREVEEALEAHPAIREAVVIGRPSEEWGETVAAVVVLDGDATLPRDEDLGAFVTGRVAGYKKPREYHVIDEVPRNAMGKIDRAKVRELV